MTRDRDIERVLEQWLSEGAGRMPDHVFRTVVDRIDRVPQRRLARLMTRFITMPSTVRFAAIAAALLLAIGAVGAYSLVNSNKPDVGPPAVSASPTASLPSSAQPSAPPIADGTYTLPPAKVSDLIAMINADAKLSAADKKWLIETAFAMKGGTRFLGWVTLDHGRLTERQQLDDNVANVGTEGTYTFPDDHTMVYQEQCACPATIFTVTPTETGFRLRMRNPPEKEVDALPARVLWESAPFTRQP